VICLEPFEACWPKRADAEGRRADSGGLWPGEPNFLAHCALSQDGKDSRRLTSMKAFQPSRVLSFFSIIVVW
jgi:hypothetical protein